jgi:HAD superfamily hydrolase (TIGR01484 family)
MIPAFSIVALATDYDETLASNGAVAPRTLQALKRLRASGRKLLLVTGRELDDLLRVCPDVGLFDCVIVENGAVLYDPSNRKITAQAPPPPERVVQALRKRGIQPLSVGQSIVATLQRKDAAVRRTIAETGIPMEIIFNRDALMILPPGIDKGSGLVAALKELQLPPEAVVGIGDAENDEPFLRLCGSSIAVANAMPAIKELADVVTIRERGEGVIEVINHILAGTLETLAGREAYQRK